MKKKHIALLLSAAMLSQSLALSGCGASSSEGQTAENLAEEATAELESESEVEMEIETEIERETEIAIEDEASEDEYNSLKSFSYELFSKSMDEENPVLSPVSAYVALSMAGLGAENNTKTEFEAVLGEYSNMTAVCSDVMKSLPTSSENNTLSLACSAWVDDEMNVLDSWISDIDEIMSSEVYQTDLSAQETVSQINGWIEDKTNGLIEEMVSEPFDEDMRLVLLNTIYFKAKWASAFYAADTYDDTFYLEDGSEIEVSTMHKWSGNMDYVSNDFAEGLIFPYQDWGEGDGNFAMLVLKPTGDSDVREMYSRLTDTVIADLIENKQTELVNTSLPKFEIDFDKKLNDSLIEMGLTDAFNEKTADFSKIGVTDTGNGVYIDLVRQKAKIIVDEDGTEAAAATMVAMEKAAALIEEEPLEVYFDSPFVYIVMDMDREIPLFIGILDNPAAE